MIRTRIATLLITLLVATPCVAQLSQDEKEAYRPAIEEGLQSAQTSVRKLSVLALGALEKKSKALRPYADDEDPAVRNAALVALALRGDKKGRKGIIEVLGEAEATKLDALIEELVRPLEPKARKTVLKSLLKKPASEEHRKAFLRFIARDGGAELYELAEGVAKIKDEAAQDAAVRVLIAHPRAEAVDVAKRLMKSRSEASQKLGLELARAVGDDGAELIIDALDAKSDAIKAAAEEHLIAMRHRAIVPLLEGRIKENPRDTASISVLLEYDGIDLTETLIPVVEGENPRLEQADYNAILGLVARSKTPRAHELITAKLASTFPADREAASYAIGFTEDRIYTPALKELLFDGSASVRKNAARSMGMIKDPAYLEPLAKAFQGDADPEVKRLTIEAMGQVGDPAAINDLMFILTGSDNTFKFAALDALVDIKSLDAAPAIELLTSDPDPRLRWQAVVSLYRIDPLVYAERLTRAVKDAPEDAFFETLATLPADVRDTLEQEVLRSERASLAIGIVRSAGAQGRDGVEKVRFAADKSPDQDVFKAALDILARYHLPEDVDRFKKAARSTDRQMRLLGLEALLNYPSADTADVFTEASGDDEPLIKMLGIYGLIR